MGRVESEQVVVHYPSDPLLGPGFRHIGPIYEFRYMYVGLRFRSRLSWLIYFTVVGAPPYPGFSGCFLTYVNQDIVFLWAILIIWDARKCEYALQPRPSSD